MDENTYGETLRELQEAVSFFSCYLLPGNAGARNFSCLV